MTLKKPAYIINYRESYDRLMKAFEDEDDLADNAEKSSLTESDEDIEKLIEVIRSEIKMWSEADFNKFFDSLQFSVAALDKVKEEVNKIKDSKS